MKRPVHDVVVESVLDIHHVHNHNHTNDLVVTFNSTGDASSTHDTRLACSEVCADNTCL